MKIGGYLIREEINRGDQYSVYRGQKDRESGSFILKVLDKSSARMSDALQTLKREYDFLCRIDSPFVVKGVEWLDLKKYAAVVLEDIHGGALRDEIDPTVPIEIFLSRALQITNGLEAIHRCNIIHKNINPGNIVLEPQSGGLNIIDFNIAVAFDMKESYIGNPEELLGTLPYISPEQTGRVNRRVDQRTDLYSLGVTFYQMLTGQLPFQHSTPIEIVYAHLARHPEIPHHLNPKIPGILSRIVLKLMAKNPEERYQSAAGLRHDLETVQLRSRQDFVLGRKDFSGKLHIPEKLYGREKEIEQLLDAYRNVSGGARELVMVTGYSGTGKTALVKEIHTPITRDRGYFINGKFDQLRRTVPYFAFIHALDQLCHLMLAEKQELLDKWKERILAAVGKLGGVLNQVIPGLQTVIGPQPIVPPLGGKEAKRRFNHVFMRFLQAVADEEHPLVMFIDDLQWADLASLEVLQLLMEYQQNNHLFLIGSYRENEVPPTHPLSVTLEALQKQHITVHTIAVKNLSLPHVQQWLRETLSIKAGGTESDELRSLTRLVYQKTRGNAFFTIRFLKNLYEHNLLRFDFVRGRWTWDLGEIRKQNITDNVVDLLVTKIQTLPADVQEVLKMAACIGNVFAGETLEVICTIAEIDITRALETAMKEELIYLRARKKYNFVHDRIHQAAYSLISEAGKKILHLKIGRLLLHDRKSPDGELTDTDGRGFDIVNHLNMGITLMTDEKEKIQLARLNLESGQKARLSGAYKLAVHYVLTAVRLLPDYSWQQHYRFSLEVFNEAVQASFLSGNLEDMKTFVDAVLNNAHAVAHTAIAHEHLVLGLMARNEPQNAVIALLTIFNQVGVLIPSNPTQSRTRAMVTHTQALLKQKGIAALARLPLMKDPGKQMAVRLFYNGSAAFAYAAQDIALFVTAALVELILEQGHTPESPYVLAGFGTKMAHMGDIAGGYRMGETALELLEQGIGNDAIRIRAVSVICFYLSGNKQHFNNVCRLMMDTYTHAMETGDIQFTGYLLTNYIMCLSRTDTPLTVVHEKALQMRKTIDQLKQSILIAPLLIEIAAASALMGKTAEPARLDMSELEVLFQSMHGDTRNIYRWQVNIKQVMLGLLFDDQTLLLQRCSEAESLWEQLTSPITYIKSDFYFYIPLAYLRLCNGDRAVSDRKTYLSKVRKSIKLMKQWADFGPVNFQHKYFLMQAELYRVTGRNKKAGEFYEKAVDAAYENDYINEAALANELAARFYMQKDQLKLCGVYLAEARNCYRKWGAVAKVRQLEETYPKYLRMGAARAAVADLANISVTKTTAELIDVKSILKASHTLSGEVQLKGLLEKMMHILIENAGAQKSMLIREQAGRLLIQAEGGTEGVYNVLQALPVEESDNIPLSVINYTARSKKMLVFDNISKDAAYSNDPYIRTNQPKSVVCFPISNHGRLSAIIYLENNQVEGAFTSARLEVLNMLTTQIAISVENTELYENLEEKVRQRTTALQKTHEQLERNHAELEQSHRNINDSVNYASRIQEAVLPSIETFVGLLPSSFIIYWPCSTISGDFYWLKQVGRKLVVAAADCTGHGVPGALISMLGMAFLNEIVLQLNVTDINAGEILNQLRRQVKTALRQEEGRNRQKEGMDIALCIIDPDKKQLHYAGAYNPLYIVRNSELISVKADHMPIGVYHRETPFTNHIVPFQENDMLYLFSDGYADQNSTANSGDAKFTKKRFKELLIDISTQPISHQERILTRRFEEWKGNLPQRDDVLIIGIRL